MTQAPMHPTTLGELRRADYVSHSVREESRMIRSLNGRRQRRS